MEESCVSTSHLLANEQEKALHNSAYLQNEPLQTSQGSEGRSLQSQNSRDIQNQPLNVPEESEITMEQNLDRQIENNQVIETVSENSLPQNQGHSDNLQSHDMSSSAANNVNQQTPRSHLPSRNGFIWKFLNINALRRRESPDEVAEDIVIKTFFLYAYLGIMYSLSILVLEKYLHPYCLFSSSICFCLVMTVESFILPRQNPGARNSRRQLRAKLFKSADWLLFAMFLFAAAVRYYPVRFSLTPYAMIGSVNILLSHFFSSTDSSPLKKTTKIQISLCFWAQVILISLKVDDIIDNWLLVWIGLFYVLIFCMTLSIGVILALIPKLIRNRRVHDPDYPLIGLVWIVLNGPNSWIWFFLLFGITQQLKSQDGKSMIIYASIVGLFHALVLVTITAYKLENIFIYLANTLEDYFCEPLHAMPAKFFETMKENIRYLLKMSPTYFMVVKENFKTKDKEVTEKSKKQMKKAKLQTKTISNPRKVNQINTKPGVNLLEMNSATVSYQGRLTCSTPVISQASFDLCYSDNDADIIEEVQQFKEESDETEKNCVICCLNAANAVFMNCGHGGVCYICAMKTWNNCDNCLFCRQPIDEVLKVNLIEKISVAKVTEGTKRRVCIEDE